MVLFNSNQFHHTLLENSLFSSLKFNAFLRELTFIAFNIVLFQHAVSLVFDRFCVQSSLREKINLLLVAKFEWPLRLWYLNISELTLPSEQCRVGQCWPVLRNIRIGKLDLPFGLTSCAICGKLFISWKLEIAVGSLRLPFP